LIACIDVYIAVAAALIVSWSANRHLKCSTRHDRWSSVERKTRDLNLIQTNRQEMNCSSRNVLRTLTNKVGASPRSQSYPVVISFFSRAMVRRARLCPVCRLSVCPSVRLWRSGTVITQVGILWK